MSSATGSLSPLPMSQTKDELLKYLNMAPEAYTMMAHMSAMQKEADHVYKWLTSDKNHLKKNCSKRPPYDWGDIMERSKDEAISAIARNGTELTSYYWNLAGPTEDCSNWLAKWFLYHKFRYRDGRNRHAIIDEGRHPHSSGSKHSHHKRTSGSEGKQHSEHDQDQPYYPETHSRTTIHEQDHQRGYGHTSTGPSSTSSYAPYSYNTGYMHGSNSQSQYNDTPQTDGNTSGQLPYDPVRDNHPGAP